MKKSNDIHFVPPCHFRLGSVPLQTLCQPVLASHKRDSVELVLRCLKYLRLREEIHCNSQKLRFGVSMFCQTMAHNGLLSSCMYSLQAALKYLVNLNAAKMQLMTIVPPGYSQIRYDPMTFVALARNPRRRLGAPFASFNHTSTTNLQNSTKKLSITLRIHT